MASSFMMHSVLAQIWINYILFVIEKLVFRADGHVGCTIPIVLYQKPLNNNFLI